MWNYLLFFSRWKSYVNYVTHPNSCASSLDALHFAGNGHLVALFLVITAIAVGKVYMTASLLHHAFNGQSTFPNDVRVIGVADVELHRDAIALLNMFLRKKY